MLKHLALLLIISLAPLHAQKQQVEKEVCQVYFSPEDHLADRLIECINQENKSIMVAVYAFSHKKIAEALCAAKARGVEVEVIIDPYSLNFTASLDKMAEAGIPISIWDPLQSSARRVNGALMHDKFCLFGDKFVWTGSFNFTHKADNANQENAIVIHDKAIVKKFKKQFQILKERGCRAYPVRSRIKDR
ncbi:MAG: DUF1669 domain-containing protein [Chlamydiales bacterium]|nr:DUF1669 domain-containing protein [Chlamydiales bacterium]